MSLDVRDLESYDTPAYGPPGSPSPFSPPTVEEKARQRYEGAMKREASALAGGERRQFEQEYAQDNPLTKEMQDSMQYQAWQQAREIAWRSRLAEIRRETRAAKDAYFSNYSPKRLTEFQKWQKERADTFTDPLAKNKFDLDSLQYAFSLWKLDQQHIQAEYDNALKAQAAGTAGSNARVNASKALLDASTRQYVEQVYNPHKAARSAYEFDVTQLGLRERAKVDFATDVYTTEQAALTSQRNRDSSFIQKIGSDIGSAMIEMGKNTLNPQLAKALEAALRERFRAAGIRLPKEWSIGGQQTGIIPPEIAHAIGRIRAEEMLPGREMAEKPQYEDLTSLPTPQRPGPLEPSSPQTSTLTPEQLVDVGRRAGVPDASGIVQPTFQGIPENLRQGAPGLPGAPAGAGTGATGEGAARVDAVARGLGLTEDQRRVVHAVIASEGGYGSGKAVGGEQSFGALKFLRDRGQLPGFAAFAGVDQDQAAALLQQDPLAGLEYALRPGGYLRRAMDAGVAANKTGPELAVYVSRHGQIPAEPHPERLRDIYLQMFGGGSGAESTGPTFEGGNGGGTSDITFGGENPFFGEYVDYGPAVPYPDTDYASAYGLEDSTASSDAGEEARHNRRRARRYGVNAGESYRVED